MRKRGKRCFGAVALCAGLLVLGAAPARADFSDPLFVFKAGQNAKPGNEFEGPCGIAVDPNVNFFYVADYYHHAVDVFSSVHTYVTQLTGISPLDGPCGLAVSASGALYVNDYHQAVIRYLPSIYPPIPSTTYGGGVTIDSEHPTGVAVDPVSGYVYVDDRTYVAVYDATGAPVEVSGEPLRIGLGSLEDGYGIAVSRFPATAGYLYVPDAATNTVEVYDPATDIANPVASIAGPPGGFVSLRDSAVAVDNVSGEIYVADATGSPYSENPQATIEVFDATGPYKGHLKYNVVDAYPPGLAVDNSPLATQGRVYVTSGNTEGASVIAYPPGAATTAPALPPIGQEPPESESAGASAPPAAAASTAGTGPASVAPPDAAPAKAQSTATLKQRRLAHRRRAAQRSQALRQRRARQRHRAAQRHRRVQRQEAARQRRHRARGEGR